MTDIIIKCSGSGCLIKDSCKRYKGFVGNGQFTQPPFFYENGKFNCVLYVGNKEQTVESALKKVLKVGKRKENIKPKAGNGHKM